MQVYIILTGILTGTRPHHIGLASGVHWNGSKHELIWIVVPETHLAHPNVNWPLFHIRCNWFLKLFTDDAQTTAFSNYQSHWIANELQQLITNAGDKHLSVRIPYLCNTTRAGKSRLFENVFWFLGFFVLSKARGIGLMHTCWRESPRSLQFYCDCLPIAFWSINASCCFGKRWWLAITLFWWFLLGWLNRRCLH